MHARLGEILYLASSANEAGADKYLAESMRRFCRSIELCDDYLRGYYGLKLVRIFRSRGLWHSLLTLYRRPANYSPPSHKLVSQKPIPAFLYRTSKPWRNSIRLLPQNCLRLFDGVWLAKLAGKVMTRLSSLRPESVRIFSTMGCHHPDRIPEYETSYSYINV